MIDPDDGELTASHPAPSTDGLRKASRAGGRWGLVGSASQQVASIAATMVLARSLSPREFGLAALAQSMVSFLYSFAEAGFGASLVVRRTVDPKIVSSLFWAACAVGGAATVLGVAIAVPAAAALGEPAAAPYLTVASLLVVTGMTQSFARSILARDLRFGAIAIADVVGVALYVVVQVSLVLTTDLGAWVVVIGWLVMSVATLATMMLLARWRPSFAISGDAIRADLGFNAGFLGASVASFGTKNLDNWSISRWMGVGPLGAYYVAYVLPNILRQRITWVASQVLLPVLSRMASVAAVGTAFVELAQFATFLAFPVLFGLTLVAEPVVSLFFGPQWSMAVAPMRVLSVAAALDTVAALTVPVLLSRSKSGRVVRTNLLRLVALTIGIAIVVATGPTLLAVSVAVLVSTIVGLGVSLGAVHGLTAMGFVPLGRALTPCVVATGAMCAMVLVAQRALDPQASSVVQLLVSSSVGACTYAAAFLLLFRSTFTRSLAECYRFATGR